MISGATFEAHDAARVLAEAGGVDARADRFALPLAGVPVAVTTPARRDDELVRRLRVAGALVVGRTRTRDSGCSGGAAAVAAGMAALAIGTGRGRGMRIPTGHCGVVGLTPGAGLVPLPGDGDGDGNGDRDEYWYARTAQDAALMLGVLTGSEAEPVIAEPGPDDWPGRVALALRGPVRGRLHADHRAAVVGAAARLRAGPAGATVVITDPPYPRAARWTPRWSAGRRGFRFGPPRPDAAQAWQDRFLAWFDGHDLLLGPAWSLAGLPAVVAPVTVRGQPFAVQLVGRPGDERRLLAAAARLEGAAVPGPRAVSAP